MIIIVRKAGIGRPDIYLRDRDNRRAMIIESKRSMKASLMDKDCDKALAQIKSLMYDKDLPDGYEQLLCVGVSFYKKRCIVKIRAEQIVSKE